VHTIFHTNVTTLRLNLAIDVLLQVPCTCHLVFFREFYYKKGPSIAEMPCHFAFATFLLFPLTSISSLTIAYETQSLLYS
jgi:hypothetical protein